MNIVVLSNIIGGIGMSMFLISSLIKSKRNILNVQNLGHIIGIIAEAMSQTYSSIVQEIISIIRNLITLKGKNSHAMNVFLVSIGAIIGIIINIVVDGNLWYGYLPVIGNAEYTFCVVNDRLIDEKHLKLSLAASNFLWAIYFLLCGLYVSGIFNIVVGCTSLYSFFTYGTTNQDELALEQ